MSTICGIPVSKSSIDSRSLTLLSLVGVAGLPPHDVTNLSEMNR